MALIAAQLSEEIIPPLSTLWDLSPCQYLSRDNLASHKSNNGRIAVLQK